MPMSASDHNPISPWQEFIAQASELQILQKKNDGTFSLSLQGLFLPTPKYPKTAVRRPNHTKWANIVTCALFSSILVLLKDWPCWF